MIMVQKATSLAYSLHDGLSGLKDQELTPLQREMVLRWVTWFLSVGGVEGKEWWGEWSIRCWLCCVKMWFQGNRME